MPVLPCAASVTDAMYVPAGNPPGFTAILSGSAELAVLLVPGETVSHDAESVAVKLRVDDPVLVMVTTLGPGRSDPITYEKEIELGWAFSAGVFVIVSETGNCSEGKPDALMVTVPT